MLTLNIHHKGIHGAEVPNIVKKICFNFIAKLLCLKITPEPHSEEEVTNIEYFNKYYHIKVDIRCLQVRVCEMCHFRHVMNFSR